MERGFFMPKNRKQIRSKSNAGQHFLHNKRLIHQIISIANIQPNETTIDIGAGLGAFSLPLAEKANRVIAVENDPQLFEKLSTKTKEKTNISVVHQDFLQFSLPRHPYVVVANIPYSITTSILHKLLHIPSNCLDRAVLIIEKGPAKRFTKKIHTNPNILKWRMCFEFKIGQTIGPENFSPPPRVDSVVFSINRRIKPMIPAAEHHRFWSLASYALKYPNLPVSEALLGVFTSPQITRLLRTLKIDRNSTICSINEQQWATIFQTMTRYVPSYRWPK
ncbi:23S ribosomal RNA methyltransferase Erm [Shimazuella sp. KC615]|uniref:23S ribosomal RNA methyltransferase Erm n=2 Tax=Shimazuella alba TaxID=2690964 RepID=A0A6I4VUU8_9BACL|nr:23S ribosomal RNA methyltransferase Erm [Shimazuella alba]